MKIRRLRYFLALSEEHHFGRAAQKLHITQPTLSQQIMMLEKDLGVQLFFRDKNISHTEAGKSLECHAKRIMSLIELARGDVKETAQGKSGILSLGYVGFAMDGVLPAIIDQFRKRYPKVELKFLQMTANLQLAEIRNGTIHAGIFRLSGQNISDLDVRLVHQDNYFLAVPSEHHLSKEKYVSIRNLSSESIILLDRHIHPGLHNEWQRIFSQKRCLLNIVQETRSYQTSIALVSAGLGISFVPESSTFLKRKGVVFLKLRGKTPEPVLYLCYQKASKNTALQNFINLVEMAKSNN